LAANDLKLPEGFTSHPEFNDPAQANALLEVLWREVDWRQEEIMLFGRRVRQPRLVGWSADPGVVYGYSGIRIGAAVWPEDLDRHRRLLDRVLDARFNSVLVNAYRDGDDSMGWHSDDEPELGQEPLIASVSLGATRRLRVRPKAGGPSLGIDLVHGSLLVMRGRSQADWSHAVPKTRRPVGLRINLTFREVRVE
jgi:alkylated DNA repair dioxygenase AlkB